MEPLIDAVARDLARGLSRQQFLRRAGGAIVVAAFTTVSPVDAIAKGGGQTCKNQPKGCGRQTYDTAGTRFTGKPIQADPAFFPALDSINNCAGQADVNVVVTSSYRPPSACVSNAVAKPAKFSNHNAGHAIDCNVQYQNNGKSTLCNDKCMGGANAPEAVTTFIDCVKGAGLRWGGDFAGNRDPVHFDDGLNQGDPDVYKQTVLAMSGTDCPKGQTCDPQTKLCQKSAACDPNQPNTCDGCCDAQGVCHAGQFACGGEFCCRPDQCCGPSPDNTRYICVDQCPPDVNQIPHCCSAALGHLCVRVSDTVCCNDGGYGKDCTQQGAGVHCASGYGFVCKHCLTKAEDCTAAGPQSCCSQKAICSGGGCNVACGCL